MDCSTPGFPVHHQLLELSQTRVHRVGDAIQPSHLFCHSLLLVLIFPSIRVFPSEPVLRMRWPKYWSLSFSISPSNEYSGLISFTIDWFDFLKESPFNAGDVGLIPGLGRSPGEGKGYPLQYSGLENSKGVTKSRT